MVAGWWWQLLGSPMTASVLLLRSATTLTSVSSSSGLSFPRQLSAPLFSFPSFLYSPVLPFCFFFLFKFVDGGVCFSLNLSSLSTSPLFFLPSSFYFRSLALPWCFTPSVSPLFLSNNYRSLSRSPSLSLSNKNVPAPLLSPFFSLCTPSVFIGRGREGHPALSSHGAGHGGLHGGSYCKGHGSFGVKVWWCQ